MSGKKNQCDCCCLVGLFSLDGRWDVRKNDGWMDAWMDGGTNFDGAEALGLPWGAQVAMGVVEGPSGVPSRRERRRARNVTTAPGRAAEPVLLSAEAAATAAPDGGILRDCRLGSDPAFDERPARRARSSPGHVFAWSTAASSTGTPIATAIYRAGDGVPSGPAAVSAVFC